MNETGSKRLLVLGAGTAGTMVANKISQRLPDWSVTVVSRDDIQAILTNPRLSARVSVHSVWWQHP